MSALLAFLGGALAAAAVAAWVAVARGLRVVPLDAERDNAARQFQAGYVHGWTEGRRAAAGEELSKAKHPTAHPLSTVRRLYDGKGK
jgi:hypothetical protein